MQRTQIYLPKNLKADIERFAQKRGISMGKMVRIILEMALTRQEELIDQKSNAADILTLADLKFKGKPTDIASKFDDYLYDR